MMKNLVTHTKMCVLWKERTGGKNGEKGFHLMSSNFLSFSLFFLPFILEYDLPPWYPFNFFVRGKEKKYEEQRDLISDKRFKITRHHLNLFVRRERELGWRPFLPTLSKEEKKRNSSRCFTTFTIKEILILLKVLSPVFFAWVVLFCLKFRFYRTAANSLPALFRFWNFHHVFAWCATNRPTTTRVQNASCVCTMSYRRKRR